MAMTIPVSQFFPYFAAPPLRGPEKPILIASAPLAGSVKKRPNKTNAKRILVGLLFMVPSFSKNF
jgi:hypothetical protein